MSQDFSFLQNSSVAVAQRLIGCTFVRTLGKQTLVGKIVETEAYDQTDAASHSYRGQTRRNDVMFGPAGHLYVYFTYGMHHCCNVVTGAAGYGSGVLIRALEPLDGEELMQQNRHGITGKNMTNGPGKLCQALDIDKRLSGHDLLQPPLQLHIEPALPASQIVQTVRVGISQAKDVPWRFYLKDSPYVSKR